MMEWLEEVDDGLSSVFVVSSQFSLLLVLGFSSYSVSFVDASYSFLDSLDRLRVIEKPYTYTEVRKFVLLLPSSMTSGEQIKRV
jgi:hypothetical protein